MRHALHIACENGKLAEVKDILKNQHVSIDLPDVSQDMSEEQKGILPIHIAAKAGHLEIVKYLIDNSAKTTINYENKKNFSLLYYACECDDEDKKKNLLEYIYNNFDKCRFEDGTTRLHVAAALGYLSECQENKEQLLVASQSDFTPLYFILYNRHYTLIESIFHTVEKFNDIDNISDEEKRIFVQIYQICGDMQCENGDDSLASKSYDYVIHFINALAEKTDQDMRSLIKAYLDFCLALRGSLALHQCSEILNKIVEAFGNIKNKIDQDYRDLAKGYSYYNNDQMYKNLYVDSASTTQIAIDTLKIINQKTERDIFELDVEYAHLSSAYRKQGNKLLDEKNANDAVDFFVKAINAFSLIVNKSSFHIKDISDVYLKLAKIYQILPLHPKRIHPVICYRNAVVTLLETNSMVSQDYLPALRDIYSQWALYYSDHTLGKRFTLMSQLAFQGFNAQTNFAQSFMQIYYEITEAKNHYELMEWLPSLIQFMEVLLKINKMFALPYTNGLQFLKANPVNLKFFEESLEKFKSLKLSSLAKSIEFCDVLPIALFKKVSAAETKLDEFNEVILDLKKENEALKRELAELKSQNVRAVISNNTDEVQNLYVDNKCLPSVNVTTIQPVISAVEETISPLTTVTNVKESVVKISSATSPFWNPPKIPRKLSDENVGERADDAKRQKFGSNT